MGTLRRLGAGAAAAAVAVTLVIAPGSAGAADTINTPTPTFTAAGLLTLKTTSTGGTFALDKGRDGGTPDATQAVTGVKSTCLISTNDSLVAVDGRVGTSVTSDLASFQDGSIGVAEKRTGTSCYQVNAATSTSAAETLTLRFATAALGGALGSSLVSSALLDVELKQSARVLATAYRDGVAKGGFEVRSGSTIGTYPGVSVGGNASVVFNCNSRADSGPDSGPSDNCRWPISSPSWLPAADDGVYFDTLELTALNGSFSLEGGSDGAVTNGAVLPAPPSAVPAGANVFELTGVSDGVLGCFEYTPVIPGSTTTLTPSVSVRRLGNASAGELCVPVNYTMRNGVQEARFLKSLTAQTSAQFVFTLTWTGPFGTAVPTTTALPETTANYETADARDAIPLGWCPDPVYDSGQLSGITDVLTNAAIPDQDTVLTGKQFSCVVSRSTTVVNAATDYVEVVEQVYVLGDILLQKGR